MQLTPPNPMPMQALGKIPTPELAKAMNQILTTTQQVKRQAMQPELAPRSWLVISPLAPLTPIAGSRAAMIPHQPMMSGCWCVSPAPGRTTAVVTSPDCHQPKPNW